MAMNPYKTKSAGAIVWRGVKKIELEEKQERFLVIPSNADHNLRMQLKLDCVRSGQVYVKRAGRQVCRTTNC